LNGLSRVHECDRQTTARQTDAVEKCVGLGGIAWTARMMLPKTTRPLVQKWMAVLNNEKLPRLTNMKIEMKINTKKPYTTGV